MREIGREGKALADLGSHSLTALIGHVATLLLGAAGVVLMTRLLEAEGYGRLAFLTSAGQLFFVIGIQWTMTALVRFGRAAIARDTDPGQIVGSWLAVVGASSALTLVVVAIVAPGLRSWSGSSQAGLLTGVFILGVAAAKAQEQLLLMASRLRNLVLSRVFGKMLFCGALGALLLREGAGGGSAEQVVLWMAASFGLQALGLLQFVNLGRLRQLGFSGDDAVRVALYSLPFLGRSVFGYLLDWMDVVFLRCWRTTAEIGVYQVAYQWMIVASEALGAVLLPVLPLLTGQRALGSETFARRYAVGALPQISVLWTLSLCTLGLVGSPLASAIFDVSFAELGRILALLLVAGSFQATLYGALPFLASHDLARHGLRISAVMVAVNLVLDLLLIESWGAFGAALATSVAYATGGVLHARILAGHLGVRVTPFVMPACLGLPGLLAAALPVSPWVKASGWLISCSALVVWARRARLFTAAGFEDLEQLRLPAAARRCLGILFRALGARP